jgi:uncharacterized membrane protein
MSTRRIKKINPVQAGKVSAVIAVLLILIIFVPFLLLFSATGFGGNQSSFGGLAMGGSIVAMVILMPILYGIFAFLFGMFYAFLYNVTYRFHGGLEMEYDDMDDEINRIGS